MRSDVIFITGFLNRIIFSDYIYFKIFKSMIKIRINNDCLQVREIASDPDDRNTFVTTFNDISSIRNDIKDILCDSE